MNKEKLNLLDGDISSILIKLTYPIMIASFVRIAYSMIDIFWIGKISANATAAIGTAGLILWLIESFSGMYRAGTIIKVGHCLGVQDNINAKNYIFNGILLNIVISFFVSVVLIFFSSNVISIFNLNQELTNYMAISYLEILGIGVFFNFSSSFLSGIFMASGNSKIPFYASLIGIFTNSILDPILIFYFNMGLKGVAIATLTSQVLVFLYYYFISKKLDIFQKIRFEISVFKIKEIIILSFPVAIQTLIFSSFAVIVSRFVANYSDYAVAAQRIGVNIESISYLVSESISIALSSFVAQNYSAKKFDRMYSGFRKTIIFSIIWSIFTTTVLFFFSNHLLFLFTNNSEIIRIGNNYLKIIAYSQIFMCVNIITAAFFNGCGKTFVTSIVGIVIISLRIPFGYFISSNLLDLNYLWHTLSVTTIVLCVITTVLYKYYKKNNYF